jgi:hypothetical protein
MCVGGRTGGHGFDACHVSDVDFEHNLWDKVLDVIPLDNKL